MLRLIQKTEYGEDLVFAHEYGDWMILTKYDYKLIYKQLTKTQ